MLSDTLGVHHVSVVAGDPTENRRFYAETLGLRFLLRTVNFEEPFVYHLYYGDERGTPGSVLTFFTYPREDPGRIGKPDITTAALRVPADSIAFWHDRLADRGVAVEPTERFGDSGLAFEDPDGTSLELVGVPDGEAAPIDLDAGADHPWTGGSADGSVPAEHAIRGVRGVSVRSADPYVTASLLDTFGFEIVAERDDAVRYRLPGGRESVVDLLTDDAEYGKEGRGSIHHVALTVEDGDQLREWRELLDERDFDVSRVKDRHFFESLYVRDGGGVLFELATERPGLGVAERDPDPGGDLVLPPWLADDREMIEGQLPPFDDW
ncbi:VOC family protein [Halosimplex carlsbadense]|uniref:VOC family protein n=1 Tax=Halosimplex carlsbadense TaxID=171164 RepID=UPI000677A490|nr:VOC family protein [Halosimplex carlsbadense]